VPSDDQRVRHADVDGRAVAWTATGSGPTVLMSGWWSSHLGVDWRNARFRRYVERFGGHVRVVRYDRPGSGLSDRDGPTPATLDGEVAVLTGLVDALGLESFAVVAGSSGVPVSAAATTALNAADPGRVTGLVLYGGYAHGADIAAPEARDAMVDVVRAHWGLGSRVLADVFMPTASSGEREEFARFQRSYGSSAEAAEQLAHVYELDARPVLTALAEVPTLVLHRRGDRAIPFWLGEDLAQRIPNARLVPLTGQDHLPWLGDSAAIVDETLAHLGVRTAPLGRAATGSPSSLTVRELDVLRLVATGLTDAEIAAQLVLSAHTVHRHVSNIRLKLGVPTRAAAAAWAAQRDAL
jgi:pimeloyl-ACP methyl ester carboxylesterase/DNA-binding CsgD family transcriptional regulator